MKWQAGLLAILAMLFGLGTYQFLGKNGDFTPVPRNGISRVPQSDPNSTYGWPNNCNGKAYCITVFVAPWCPICKSQEPVFKLLQSYLAEHRPDVGFGLVTSSGTPAQNLAERAKLSPIEVTLDDSNSIMQNRRIEGYPTWIVNDASGNELFNKAGARALASEADIAQFLAAMNIN